MVKKLRRNKNTKEKANKTNIINNLNKRIFADSKSKFITFALVFGVIGSVLLVISNAAPDDPRASLPAVRSFGIFPGYAGDDTAFRVHTAAEKEMGRKIWFADAFLEISSEANFRANTFGLFEDPNKFFCVRNDVTINLSVPISFGTERRLVYEPGGPAILRERFLETARGERDDIYKLLGERLMKCGQKNAILRIASEMDIPFNAYTMIENEDVFKDAFRHVVTVLRATPGNNFKIDFMGNGSFHSTYTTRTGQVTTKAEAAFPGAQYVDIIGIDIYNRQSWDKNIEELNKTQAMAKKYGKPMSIPEWGLWTSETGDDPQFIQNMYDWMNTTPRTGPGALYYNAYFYNFKYSKFDTAPKSKALFNTLFGIPVSDPSIPGGTVTPPPSPPTSSPDVIVVPGSLTTIPAAPKAGDEVTFQVTIKNNGTTATPNNVIHGVAFVIDGKNVAWSDNTSASLAPGATRTVTTNGGPDGNGTWTATAGTVPVTVNWDDVDRIAESNETNNSITANITVATGPTNSGDVTPPTSTITTAPTGVIDGNTYTINVNATDNVAVARVAIEVVGGAELVSDNTAPYSPAVNTRSLANDNYQLRAVSYDTAGNRTNSSPVTLKVRLVDINRSGTVEIGDLTAVISSWNQNNPAVATNPANDLDDDGVIGIGDLTKIISRWGL